MVILAQNIIYLRKKNSRCQCPTFPGLLIWVQTFTNFLGPPEQGSSLVVVAEGAHSTRNTSLSRCGVNDMCWIYATLFPNLTYLHGILIVSCHRKKTNQILWNNFPSFCMPSMKSPRNVQQIHPLFISTTVSVVLSVCSTKLESMPTSPNSFSMTASRFPWRSRKMRFNKVVLPLPKKPVITLVAAVEDHPRTNVSGEPWLVSKWSGCLDPFQMAELHGL